jgi:hypothetical protein
MDTGINMLGQFQGDSSLGLGSSQASSALSAHPWMKPGTWKYIYPGDPKIPISGAWGNCITPVNFYSGWDSQTEEKKAEIQARVDKNL